MSKWAVSFNQLMADRIVYQLNRVGLIAADQDGSNKVEAINIVRYMLENGKNSQPRKRAKDEKARAHSSTVRAADS